MCARRCGLATVLAAVLATMSIAPATAGIRALPEIPVPALTPEQALAIARREVDAAYLLVALEWANPSEFQPHVNDGTNWHALDSKDEYAWLVTYVFHDKQLAGLRSESPFNAVCILRIKPDGTIDFLVGTR